MGYVATFIPEEIYGYALNGLHWQQLVDCNVPAIVSLKWVTLRIYGFSDGKTVNKLP